MSSALIFLLVVAFLVITVIGLYNNFVRLRQNLKESWSAVDTELKRRYDLIPNLVETVKGYATHEKTTFEEVVQARNSALSVSGSPEAQAKSETVLSNALGKLFALAENYPELKANQNFLSLQQELAETEDRISKARRFYNANVRDLNTAVETFPGVVLAAPMGFKAAEYFEIDDNSQRNAISVKF
jgi:LemA protein